MELTRARIVEEAHLARLIGREPVPAVQAHSPGHEHGEGSRAAWLLMAPAAAIVLIAPPALGSYAVQRNELDSHMPPPTIVDADTTPLESGRVNVLSMGEFASRAWADPSRSPAGKTVRLTGFVVPSARKNEWYLTRMRISCCAADALTMKVAVTGVPAPKTDTWVRVTGAWIPPKEWREDTYTPRPRSIRQLRLPSRTSRRTAAGMNPPAARGGSAHPGLEDPFQQVTGR
ncbi:TIGR03943 family protein [Nonomuraea jabiensis]|uniref:TIGR03943 family putative permease subunit n=1 Tax=Nonomuraea jabiensis TaxID=882448 RepID=UPI003422AA29